MWKVKWNPISSHETQSKLQIDLHHDDSDRDENDDELKDWNPGNLLYKLILFNSFITLLNNIQFDSI